MKNITILNCAGKGFFTLLAIVLLSCLVLAQDMIINGNITNNGTIRVRRDIINNTTGSVTVSGTGVVRLDRNNDDHSIRSTTGSYPIVFSNLSMTQGRPVTCQVDVTVVNNLTIGDASNAYTAGGNGFNIGTRTLTINSASSYLATSTAALTFANGTVVFNSGSAQDILNKASGVTYGTLTLSGTGAKTVVAGGTVTAATLSQTGGQLVVAENFDITGTASIEDLGNISASKVLQLTATATSASITSMNNTSTGTLRNAANISLPIGTLVANAGTIDQSGASGTISFTNAAANNGTIQTTTGTIDFNNNLSGTGTLTLSGNGNVEFGGSVAQNTYNLNNGTVAFNSSAEDQSIPSTTYNNVNLVNNTKLLAGAVTVNGNLNLDASSVLTANNNNITLAGSIALGSNVIMGSGVLTMTSTTASNVSGAGEIRGAVRRNHNFTAGQNYLFNRPDVYIGTATTAGTDITLNMSVATDPTSPASTKYVQRKYTLTPTVAGNLQAIQLHYENAELQGGITESKIGLRGYNGSVWSKITNVGQSRTSGSNVMTYSGLNNSLAGINELGMYGINFVTVADAANISTAAGWDENALPDNTDDVIINHNSVVTGASPISVATLTINAGKDLTTNNAAGTITVATSSDIAGTLNVTTANVDLAAITVGNAGVISVASGRTLTGTTFVTTSSNPSTFDGNVNLSSLTNNGTGLLAFNGNSSTISGAVTNPSGSAISIGGTLNIMTSAALTLTSEGNITVNGASGILNIGASGVASNLSMSGTSTLSLNNAASQLNVFGNLELGATATLDNSGIITIGE